MRFIGRSRELRSLERELERVASAPTDGAPGRCVLVRGRRRIGKSRLIEEFCAKSGCPYVFFSASKRGNDELRLFNEEVGLSDLPGRASYTEVAPQSWDGALRLLASTVGEVKPTIVVFDEFPYLVEDDPAIEATFQKQWDRLLSKQRVLLILIGSDLAMMEALNTHGRAFFARGTEMVVPAMSPVETGEIIGAKNAADAFDGFLITGGLPLICLEWPKGVGIWEHLECVLAEPMVAMIVSAERTLAAEFPEHALARSVLGRIGSGERTFSNIARASGGLHSASLNRSLELLAQKGIVSRDLPLSTRKSTEARYSVSDPYMRFWLRFIGPRLAEIDRGRGDRTLERISQDWTTWRGKAIEPVVREALARLSPLPGVGEADHVGGFWTRTNVPEIDLIGADASPVAKTVKYAGTVKWLDNAPLDQADLNRLASDVQSVPGASAATPLVAVSRSGVTARGAAVVLGPDDLLAAW